MVITLTPGSRNLGNFSSRLSQACGSLLQPTAAASPSSPSRENGAGGAGASPSSTPTLQQDLAEALGGSPHPTHSMEPQEQDGLHGLVQAGLLPALQPLSGRGPQGLQQRWGRGVDLLGGQDFLGPAHGGALAAVMMGTPGQGLSKMCWGHLSWRWKMVAPGILVRTSWLQSSILGIKSSVTRLLRWSLATGNLPAL